MPPAAGAQKASSDDVLRKQEALTYLRELKERLKNKKDTYDEFLEIMKEFKAQRCGRRRERGDVLFFSGIERGSRPRPTTVVATTVTSARDRSTHAHDLLNHVAGSTPTASSSASRPSSRDTKTSFSVSTSSCQRCAVARPRSALGRLETLSRSPSPIHLAASRDNHVRGTLLGIRSLASPPAGPTRPSLPLFPPAAITRVASSFFGAAFSPCACFSLGKPDRFPGPRLTSPSRVAFSHPGSRDPRRGRRARGARGG